MNYLNTANQLSFITVICFSFAITAFSLLINKEKKLSRLLGMSFIIPFVLVVFASVNNNIHLSNSLFLLAQASLLISFFILFITNPKSKNHELVYTLTSIYPIIIIIAVSSNTVENLITEPYVGTTLLIASSVLTMFILRKEKGNSSLIFWASLLFLVQSMIVFVWQNILTDYISLLCYISAYALLMLYFHKEVAEKMLDKVKQAEKQLDAVNRNLNLEVKKRVLEIERSNEMLLNKSKTDALTKALNKAAIIEIVENLTSSAKPGFEFSILMFDIDKFKTINDTLGHIVGDKCIKKLALTARNSLREIDFLGRYGGDEFIIVLPDASISHAKLVAERFRKRVEETESPHFTVSIGIAAYPKDGSTAKDLIAAADDGMYQSKKNGRNTVSHRNM